MTLVLAALIALVAVTPAWAEDATSVPTLTQTPKNNLTVDAKIKVDGLEAGDSITYYQVVKWDNGWVLTDQFKKTETNNGLTADDLATIVGNATTPGAIDSAMAVKISQVKGISGTSGGTVGTGKTSWETSGVAAGLYYVAVTPANQGVVYNPIFVAADYYTNTSNEIELVNNQNSYSDTAMAKKTKVTLEKDATTITETPVGSDVSFEVKTTIPLYGEAYTNPVFSLTDTMSAGLKVKLSTLKVYYKSGVDAQSGADQWTEVDATAYTKTPTSGDTAGAYTIAFNKSYLQDLNAATDIKIAYDATITGDVEKSVNPEENTVELKYSNNPSDTTGAGKLRDKTEHYTFDIDGILYGSNNYKASELVKVGLDKDGNEITETVELDNGNTIGALQGAKFKLYVADPTGSITIKDENGADLKVKAYTNDKISADTVFTSGADGRMNIQGLAAGTYYLVETEAPAGYIKAQNAAKIEIDATTSEKTITDADGVSYKVTTLDSYTIKINGVETANYTLTNEGTTTKIESVSEGDKNANAAHAVGEDGLIGAEGSGENAAAGKIQNTQGVELPSTGGMGTTILYTVGGILIAAGGIWLVTKKRLSAME